MEVDSHKLSNNCAWHNHINNVKINTWGIIDIMRGLKFCLDRESLETLSYLHIRPVWWDPGLSLS